MKIAFASHPPCLLVLAMAFAIAIGGIPRALADSSLPDEIFADGFDPPPAANFNFVINGAAATFADQSTDAGGGTVNAWAWDFGDGGTSTAQNPMHTFAGNGVYTVTETVFDGTNGESGTVSKSVTLEPCQTLTAYFHDFIADGLTGGHPDFQHYNEGLATGLVYPTITPGGLPTLQSTYGSLGQLTPQITSAASFAQWYVDDPINYPIQQTLTFTENPAGTYTYSRSQYNSTPKFSPLDGEGFNDLIYDGQNWHNFEFTTMLHATFQYDGSGTQTISFTGVDDVWVFINGHLVIDLGGVHSDATGSVTLTAATALSIGLVSGNTYNLDFFQAQRFAPDSDFYLQAKNMCLSDNH